VVNACVKGSSTPDPGTSLLGRSITRRKRVFLLLFFGCSSRASLVKNDHFDILLRKWSDKTPLSPLPYRCRALPWRKWLKNVPLFEYSLCLSRACLVFMIICSTKWRKRYDGFSDLPWRKWLTRRGQFRRRACPCRASERAVCRLIKAFPSFSSSFFLCLSQACLGKQSVGIPDETTSSTMRFTFIRKNRSKIGPNSLL